jgi:hypothetical protein
LTQIYDTKTSQIVARIRGSNPVLIAQKAEAMALAESAPVLR